MNTKVITRSNLKAEKGIPYCADHLRRMEGKGLFCQSFDLGAGRRAYLEAEVDEWLAIRAASRTAGGPARASETADAGNGAAPQMVEDVGSLCGQSGRAMKPQPRDRKSGKENRGARPAPRPQMEE